MWLLKTYRLLSKQHRRQGIYTAVLVLFSSLLDFFSLASFFPVILLILSPEKKDENPFLVQAQEMLGIHNRIDFGILLTALVVLFVVAKTIINRWIVHQKASYAYAVSNEIASRAMEKYLSQNYVQFSNADYTREANRICNLPITFANNILIPAGTIFSEGILFFTLLFCVAIFDLHVFLFISCILVIAGSFFLLMRKKMTQINQQAKTMYPILLKYALQTIEGFTEIKTFHKEDYFKTRFREKHKDFANVLATDHTVSMGAARVTELVGAICIGALIIYTLWNGYSGHQSLLLLTIYGGFSFRAIPSINRIFAASLQIRTHKYAADELQDAVVDIPKAHKSASLSLPFSSELTLEDIVFCYDKQHPVFNKASLTIHKGERVAIVGPSGTGKTTLLLLLLQFIRPQSGHIRLDGSLISDLHLNAFRKLFGYVPQSPYILDSSVEENIALGVAVEEIRIERVKTIIENLDLENWVNTLPDGLKTRIGERGTKISGGQRQRIAIARALYHDSEILLLDEVTNQLDEKTEGEVLKILQQSAFAQKTIILITHKTSMLSHFDTVYALRSGQFQKESILQTQH